MKSLSRLLIALSLLPLLAQAAALTQLTLQDGRRVQLNDDFTWAYLPIKPASEAPASGETVPEAPKPAAVAPETAVSAPTAAIGTAEAVKDGITVTLARIDGEDPLQLHFMVGNTSSQSVVRIWGTVTLLDEQGAVLASQEVRFWVGENRLPESYLRKGEQRPAPLIELARPANVSGKPQVRVQIGQVEFR